MLDVSLSYVCINLQIIVKYNNIERVLYPSFFVLKNQIRCNIILRIPASDISNKWLQLPDPLLVLTEWAGFFLLSYSLGVMLIGNNNTHG